MDIGALFRAPAAESLALVRTCEAIARGWQAHYLANRERIEASGNPCLCLHVGSQSCAMQWTLRGVWDHNHMPRWFSCVLSGCCCFACTALPALKIPWVRAARRRRATMRAGSSASRCCLSGPTTLQGWVLDRVGRDWRYCRFSDGTSTSCCYLSMKSAEYGDLAPLARCPKLVSMLRAPLLPHCLPPCAPRSPA